MALGLGALALALPAVALPGSLWLVAVAMVALGVAASLALAPTLAELAAAVDRRGGGGYGAVYAIFNDAYAVGLTIGPLAGGFLGGALALVGMAGALYAPLLVFGVPGDAESPAETPK